jgi:hypothetical protein
MKLVAIYNAWSDCLDLLEKSIDNIAPVVEGVYVVWSNQSNHGQNIPFTFRHPKAQFFHCEPVPGFAPHDNETTKRNFGLIQAKKDGFSHFLMMDCDEFYVQQDVFDGKVQMIHDDLNGLVCPLRVYIKEPTLWCTDHTLVPFIQKLTPDVTVGAHKYFPFAYDDLGHAHIDPTRRPSHRDRIKMSSATMHHFSYVRKDMELKINNSSANLKRSREVIYRDLENARPGYVSELYHRELQECEDLFKIKGPKQL